MSPLDGKLLVMVFQLLSVILTASAVSAWLFRRHKGWQLVAAAFVASFLMYGILYIAAVSGITFSVIVSGSLFGAAIGAGLGGFAYAATERARHDNEVIFIILAVAAANSLLATLYFMVAGYDFQWCGSPLFIGLFILLSIGVIRLFMRFGRTMELFFGGIASFFLFIMLIVSISDAMKDYSTANWEVALEVVTSLFHLGFCSIQ